MKKVIFSFSIFFLLGMHCNAQQSEKKGTEEEQMKEQFEIIQDKLKLDNLEMALMKDILLRYADQRVALRTKEIPIDEKRVLENEITLKQEKELSTFLSKKQLKTLYKIVKSYRYKGKKIRRRRRNTGGTGFRQRRNN